MSEGGKNGTADFPSYTVNKGLEASMLSGWVWVKRLFNGLIGESVKGWLPLFFVKSLVVILVFLFLVPMVVGEQMPITAHNFVQIVAKEKRSVLIQIPQKTTVRVSIAEKMSIGVERDSNEG